MPEARKTHSLLIVDDEPAILQGMREKIDWLSYGFNKIATESTLSAALDTAILLRPSLCLLDVCLRREKGYELIEKLNGLGLGSNYIMMSGYSDFAFAQQAMRLGAADYLLKPVEAAALESAVGRVVTERLGGEAPKRAESGLEPVLMRPYAEFSPLVQKIFLVVRTEYATALNLKSLAEKFRMNSAYLGQLFLAETAFKFSEYLMMYRLAQAKELLLNTEDKIASVAAAVGYDDMSYFYRNFKSFFGQSPSDFRGG
jgi:YesN/AraC family two-component response regulator